jgi:hypothetical protein
LRATCRARGSTVRSAYGSSGSHGTPASLRSPAGTSLYEYFSFGDPVRMARALVSSYDREPFKERVRAFLNSE